MATGIELAPLQTKLVVNATEFKSGMYSASKEAVQEADKITTQVNSKLQGIGEGMSNVGGKLTKGVTLPLAGVGIATGKMAMDFESNFAKVSTVLDSNVVNFDDYKKDILQASSDSKISVDEFSEAVYSSISASVDQTKAVEFTTNAMKLAKGGFTSGAKAVDVMTTAINGYKLKTEDATKISDLLITTQNLGKTTVDELASSMGSVIPIASAANYSIEELSTAYALMTKNGIATSEAGTYVKSMLSEITKSGSITDKALRELTKKGFADLKKEGKSTTEIFSMLNEYAKKNNITLKDMFGSVEAGSAAMVLASGEGKEYNEILQAMGNSAGATQSAFNKIDATPAEQLKGSLNKLKNAGIQLGESLIPMVNKGADLIGVLADKFGSLTAEQQENLVKWGALAITVGPALKIIGNGISTFSTLKTTVSGVSTALGLFKTGATVASVATEGVATAAATAGGATALGGLATSLGSVAVACAPAALAVGTVAIAGYEIHKELSKDVIPTVDLFADKVTTASGQVTMGYAGMASNASNSVVKISEATKTAVQAYMDMDNQTTQALYNQKVNHAVITSDIANDTITKFQNMGQIIKDSYKSSYDEMYNSTYNFFAENSVLTEQKETEILNNITAKHQEREQVINQSMTRITEIYTNAKEQNRQLTELEMNEINTIQQQMRDNAITTLSETEQEAAVIRERMKEYQGRLTAEMASEMIQKANEARDGEIKAANEKYEEIIKQAARLKEAGLITEQEYNDMVTSATTAKDESIKAATDTCDGVRQEISNATPGIEREVDTQTGKIKNSYQRLKENLSGFFTWLFSRSDEADNKAKSLNINGYVAKDHPSPHYNGLNYVPYDGYSATLHKGERVLTAKENKEYIQGNNTSSNGLTLKIENFNNNRNTDVKQLMQEAEFYRKTCTI
ncbi:phage tail tape measure protein [Clostridium sp. ZBS3]|uniref:Phage tail tape measure protein n=4 Tax=Clostridium botulinum TaxID=1491 RepID=A0A6M0WST7_CLOBO|nr:phage tail tape measure protein [Clostridium sp. ZBS3]NFE59107.1 phage tail tape measure protein [Clostridium botulinum]NFE84540.1 phage tail tape measure protein [Clostridium botulinum]NFF88472.1 phage tail tape measure protein [Clostridium botulinum]NFG10847.1 phage tail tape measure protein [Clostridium botulinum]NFN13973.1 phage tail tape measure protein [Clostridium botulinum]